jgi:hypothetical protein
MRFVFSALILVLLTGCEVQDLQPAPVPVGVVDGGGGLGDGSALPGWAVGMVGEWVFTWTPDDKTIESSDWHAIGYAKGGNFRWSWNVAGWAPVSWPDSQATLQTDGRILWTTVDPVRKQYINWIGRRSDAGVVDFAGFYVVVSGPGLNTGGQVAGRLVPKAPG